MQVKNAGSFYRVRQFLFLLLLVGSFLVFTTPVQAAGIVSGTVHNDVNNDGFYTLGTDFSVDGVTVELQPYGGGAPINTTVTSSGGAFQFTGVPTNANYRIVVKSDTSYVSANYSDFTLAAGADNTSGELLVKGLGGSFSGSLFEDLNRNGNFDEGASSGIGSVQIHLRQGTSATSPIVSTIYTKPDGSYTFSNLPSGVAYVITVDDGDLDFLGKAVVTSSDATHMKTPIPMLKVSSVESSLIGKNLAVSEINPNGIDGIVVLDQNGDNTYIPGEDGLIAGTTITLYYDDEVTLVPGVAPVVSMGNGSYKVPNVPLWKYKLKISPLAGYVSSGVSPSSAVVSGKPQFIAVDMSAIAPYSAHNFYLKGDSTDPASVKTGISGYVVGYDGTSWSTSPGPDGGGTGNNIITGTTSGITRFANVTVTLYNSSNVLVYTQKTKTNGSYEFSNLDPGVYTVKISKADADASYSAYVFMNDTDGRSALKGNAPFEVTATLVTGPAKADQNFWFGRSNLGRLGVRTMAPYVNGNSVWNSLVNGHSTHGGFVSATFTLLQEDGTRAKNQDGTDVPDVTIGSRGTDATNNSIHFSSQIIPGIYRIVAVGGSYDSSLTYMTGDSYFETGTNASERLAMVYFRGTNTISGKLYTDIDLDNAYSAGDLTVAQARVRIYKLKADGVTRDYEMSRMGTNSSGVYNFTYLPDGKYQVVEDDLSIITGGFGSQIAWNSDRDEPAAGSAKSFIVDLSSGTTITNGDIVYRSVNTDFIIKGTAYLDLYNSGYLDPITSVYGDGDLKLDGVKIELFAADGTTPIQNGGSDVVVYTDANGAYSISGSFLTAGTYILKASKTDLTVANITAAPGSTRTITLVSPTDLSKDQVFLLQGPGRITGFRTYDAIGAGGYAGTTSPLGVRLTLYKETSPGTWQSLRALTYKGGYDFLNLEPGKYQVRFTSISTIVDTDPATPPGTIEVVVSATDTSKQKYMTMNFIEDSSFKATISGKVWLDANGNGQIDPNDVELTSADIGAIAFDIYQTPYFLTAYNDLGPFSMIPVNSTVTLSGSSYSQGSVSYGNYLVHIDEAALSSQGLQVVNNRKGSAPITAPFTVPSAYPFVNTLTTLQVGVTTANVVDQDFLVKRILPVEISGRVFYDQDYDNASSSDDIGLNEMKVTLKQAGKPDMVQQVNADGYYKFTSLLNGDYTIVLGSIPNDSNMVAAPTSPASYSVAINSGNLVSQEKNFWYHKAGEAGIAGSVMIDINNNHLLDVQSDFPSSGITVNLKQGSNIIKTTTTNSKGAYKFTGIAQDTYVIELVGPPAGYVVYQNASGQNLSSTMTLVMNAGMNSGQWFLLAGDSNTNRGEAPGGVASQKSGISGYLYEGNNATPTANRLAGAVVALYDGSTLMGSYTTGSDGKYQFYNLSVGSNYQVVLRAAPSGYGIRGDVDAITTVGTINAPISSSASNPGKHDQNMWFATLSANGIQGKVFYRADVGSSLDIPINGITVELYDKNNPPGLNSPISTTTTDATGAYQFANIATIDYIVKVLDSDKTSKNYVDLLPVSPGETTINGLLVAGSQNNNFILNGTQKISGKIWLDDNGDQAYTSGTDRLLGPAVVQLRVTGPDGIIGNADDITLRTLTTASGAGTYEFDQLPSGNYRLMVDTAAPLFSGLDLIPIASITGNVIPRDIALSATQADVDFGFEYDGSISGTLYQDVDGNGARATVDSAFGAGITVTLTNAAGTKTFTTTTLADGTYSFANVLGDTWKISASPTDYTFSFGEGGTVSGSNVQVVVTSGATSFTGVNLGYKGIGKIAGKIVLDTNLTDGGQATSIDTPIGAGIKITLSGPTGFVTREVLTNASGEYEITDLAPYVYTVGVNTTAAGFPAGLLISFDPVHGTTSPANSVSLTVPTAMTPLTQKDFGYKGRGEVSGKILVDLEGQGTYRSTHGSFASSLTVTAKQGSTIKTTTTNGSGEYSFDSLSTGVWEIFVDTGDIPSGHVFSYGQNATSVTARGVTLDIDSALLGRSAVLKATNIYLGYRGSAAIKGRLVYDNDDTDGAAYNGAVDGLFAAGYTVTLQGGSGFTPFTTTTNSSGEYTFSGLTTYADYKAVVANPAGYVFSFDPDSATVTPPTAPVGNGEAVIPITSPTQTLINQDFAFKGAGKIAGLIYTDLNDNGTYETGIDLVKTGITVTLTHATLPARTAVTNSAGEYEFTWVAAGTWSAEVTGGLSGVRFPSFDYDDAYTASSSPVTPNKSQVVLTASTPIVTDADFGYINRGKLEGVIKEDVAGTSLYDPSAPGIAGVTVHLVEHDGITPKYHLDGVTPIIMTTDSAGKFSIRNLECPLVGELYAVRVEFGPSATGPLATMEPSYDSDVLGIPGYGSGVNVSAGTHMINADLPSTTASQIAQRTEQNLYLGYRAIAGDLVIQKQVAKATAKIGDIIPYTITIENKNPISPALGVVIEDLIPAGFKYVSGSARLDGVKIEDPTGTRPLRFENINLGSPSGVGSDPVKRKLTYFLVIGAGVTEGDYVNTAVAKDSFNQNASNTSSATVQVTADPLFDDSLIFGKVYVDTNKNGIQDGDEKGLGGVKLITGRGEIITTDKEGRYHLPGVSGGRWERGINFILKLDVRSLVKGHKVLGENPTVVRLSPGIPSKIDFRIAEETINP